MRKLRNQETKKIRKNGARNFSVSWFLNFSINGFTRLENAPRLAAGLNGSELARDSMSRASSPMGFTFIELLISIAVMGVILTVVVGGLVSFRRSLDMNQAVDGVVAQLREARRRTIESKNASQWGVHVVSTSTTLFSGSTYGASGVDNEGFALPSTVIISGLSDVVFKRISGDTDNAGALTLTQDANMKVINVRSSGLVEIQ